LDVSHIRGKREIHAGIGGKIEERDYSEHLDIDEKTILKLLLYKQDGKASIGFICIKMGTSGGPLWAG
jgi:hypothetical protein